MAGETTAKETDYQFEIQFCRSILKRDEDNLQVMELLANYFTRAGEFDNGLELDRRIAERDPENAISHYNLACSLALKNHQPEAIETLRRALELGYDDFKWLMKDPDLLNLHENPAFSALISTYRVDN